MTDALGPLPVGLLTDGEAAAVRAWAEDYAAEKVAKFHADAATGLGALPISDGVAKANIEKRGEVYVWDDVDAWSEPLIRSYAAAEVAKARAEERERCAKLCADLAAPAGLSDAERSVYDTATVACESAIRAT